jgi:branched-chain amino acid transport system permease protein
MKSLFPKLADKPRAAYAATVALAIVLAVLPLVVGMAGNAWVRMLDFALLYVMLALGLNIVVGYAGLLDLGYVAFYAVGAYMYALLSSPHLAENFEWWIAQTFPTACTTRSGWWLPLGAAIAAFFGVLLGSPTLRLRGDYLAIVTLGFGEIVRIFLNNLNAPLNLTNGPQGISNIDPVRIGGLEFSKPLEIFGFELQSVQLYYYLFLLLTVAVVIVSIRLQDSRIGRAWMAVREDEIAAKAMGINTRNTLLAFAMGASFGGVSGAMFASFQGFVSPESFVLMESIVIVAMVVLGGMGHVPGVILGAVLLYAIPETLRFAARPMQEMLFGAELIAPEALRMLLFGLAMVLIMLYRPSGLWPAPRR